MCFVNLMQSTSWPLIFSVFLCNSLLSLLNLPDHKDLITYYNHLLKYVDSLT